jgi:predicted YcjX-like family ATPase
MSETHSSTLTHTPLKSGAAAVIDAHTKRFTYPNMIWGNSEMATSNLTLTIWDTGRYQIVHSLSMMARMGNYRHTLQFATADINGQYLFDLPLPHLQYPRGHHEDTQFGSFPNIRYDFAGIGTVFVRGDGIFDTGG